jgi:hypothetical protein
LWKTINGNKVDLASIDPTRRPTSSSHLPSKKVFRYHLPSIKAHLNENLAEKKARNEQLKKIEINEKESRKNLREDQKNYDEQKKSIIKDMEKGRITSGKATQMLSKIRPNYEPEKTGALPSGKIQLNEFGQHMKTNLENQILKNKKAQEDLTKQKSDNKTTKAKTATGSGNTSEDTKEWNDDLQKELEKLQKTETELELDLLKVTGVNPETEFNKNAVIPPIEKREKERSGSPGRVADSLEGSIPKEIAERRDQASKEYHEGLSGEPVPTFTTIPYQTRRIDPETGEFTSKLSDSKYEKQLKNMFAEAEKQGYYTNESLSNEQLAEALENISKNARIDPTQETPKGMGALIGLRAEMAGRSN